MNVLTRPRADSQEIVASWVGTFGGALQCGSGIAGLLANECHWRDVLAFTWQVLTESGAAAIEAALTSTLARTKPSNIHIPVGRSQPRRVSRAGVDCIEAIFEFETTFGRANAVVRLVEEADGVWRAWTLLTTLEELHGYPDGRPRAVSDAEKYSRDFGGENWLDQRHKSVAYANHDPAVLVVGGGQAGLSVAARLSHLGVDTLIIDRLPRIGDNWRLRYHSLTLHNEVHVNHLPLMPFPPTWPVFIPKDKLANWFESYVESLELNYWTGTELANAAYDERDGRWTAKLRRSDGSERTLRPRHIIVATGVSGTPIWPSIPGLDAFKGTLLHSGNYTSGAVWKDRKTLVIGTGNSGHDVAQDLCASGADVTMAQRSPTYVVSIREAQKVYSIYAEGLPFADCDLLAASMPYPVLRRAYQLSTAEMREVDRDLLQGLEKRGFRLTYGEDDTGFQMMYLRRGGGYYFNVGCSDMIVDGRVQLLQYGTIERFVPEGVALRDGTTRPLDLVVVATGYETQQHFVRSTMGDPVADRIGPVWGFDDGGELRNMWRPTNQPGLWFTAGSLAQCRIYSRYLALQIKAREDGLIA
ncbi:MAG: NAD(P)/FAD-dependent oxidoreductase [Alphaproteobacteria bacterium]|nr:NAD(P)/FAD-dependent oxidoreductase [Alphaproteobacteria bacterium]